MTSDPTFLQHSGPVLDDEHSDEKYEDRSDEHLEIKVNLKDPYPQKVQRSRNRERA
jgi:hypothetical protein